MGKKKDKASKSKKKSKTVSVVESDTESLVEPETESVAEPDTESIHYADHVNAADVMELINTLSDDLNRLEESNQLLQQQVAQNQNAAQPKHTVFKIITVILGIGIIAIGYTSAKINTRMDQNIGIASTDLDKVTSRIKTMDTSIVSMSSDINKINTNLGKLTADVTTINQNINKIASDVTRINTDTATRPNNTQYMARPMDPWQRWR